jgi:SAM-dependent methyltransferase
MRKLYYSIPFCYPHLIRQELKSCKSILDIGCGELPITVKTNLKPEYSVGVDIVPKYSKIAKNYLNEVIVSDIKYIKFCEDSFDGAVAIDIIEHFHKKDAVNLILLMKKWARKVIIIVTPNRKQPASIDPKLPAYLKEYQEHKCVFSQEELKDIGFSVYGIRGIKFLKEEWRRRIPPLKIISLATQPFIKNKAQLASGLLGVMEM